MSFASLLSCNICWNRERILPSLDFKPVNTRESISDFEHGVAADPDEPTCISKVVVVGFTTAGEGRKRYKVRSGSFLLSETRSILGKELKT